MVQESAAKSEGGEIPMLEFEEALRRSQMLIGLAYCGNGISSWAFGANTRKRYYSTCPYADEFEMMFDGGGCLDYAMEHKDFQKPMVLSDKVGLVWIAEFIWQNGEANMMVMLGPVLHSEVSAKNIENALRHTNFSLKVQNMMAQRMQTVPVVTGFVIRQYALMMHYIITNDLATVQDIIYQKTLTEVHGYCGKVENPDAVDAERRMMMEETIMQVVREGNMDYRKVLEEFDGIKVAVDFGTGNPLREAKDNLIMLAVLCMRAAMEGGLSPKTAREVERSAIHDIEQAATFTALVEVNDRIIGEFVERVHEYKGKASLSRYIQECCEYIKTHIREVIQLSDIAAQVGYTEYYLTKKFYKEMGVRLTDYIKNAKIENAKIWLLSTNKSVQEISEELSFCTRNYFSRLFKEKTGMTPVEFREQMVSS